MNEQDIIAMRTLGAGLEKDGLMWSDEDKRDLAELFHNGVGLTKIALQMKRSEPAVVQQLVKDKFFQNETKSRTRTKRERGCLCPNCANYECCKQKQEQLCKGLNAVLYGATEGGSAHV